MTYEYECQKCKRIFEVEQSISEPPLTTCEAVAWEGVTTYCRGELKRLIAGPVGFVLKGSGWAKDGYR